MIVVADAGPLRYLLLIEAVQILPDLYGQVFIPQAVLDELTRVSEQLIEWMLNADAARKEKLS